MWYLIIIQIISLLFAFATGRHDVPAVDNFTRFGSNKKHQSEFHGFNWILKICFVVSVSIAVLPVFGYRDAALLFLSNSFIIWAVFDPVVNYFRREQKKWYYLSKGNYTDRNLMKLFGENRAGKIKFIICLLVIAACNALIFLL